MMQWHYQDIKNRHSLLLKKPIYGEDCRKAVKVNLIFNDLFDVKRHKNLDKCSKESNSKKTREMMEVIPYSVFNAFAL